MAVGYSHLPEMHPVKGIRLGTVSAGIKKSGRRDLVVIEMAEGSHCAGVFTRNAFCAAPVVVAKEHLNSTSPRYLVINTGNANAGTGKQGMLDAVKTCESMAQHTGCSAEQILPFSTGVIGMNLPMEKLLSGLPPAMAALSETGWEDAAFGIMTTDTVPKGVSEKLQIGNATVTITGIIKGSGMIHPDMATMLGFIFTDAKIEQALLTKCLQQATKITFNRITVDGDTSTNDAVVLGATNQLDMPAITSLQDEAGKLFQNAVTKVCQQLAQLVIRDGEGASKYISIIVNGAGTVNEAEQVGFTVAHSPLVKTAFFASDANWGRILAAVGRAGLDHLNIDKVSIYLDDTCIVENGGRALSYTEEQGQSVMSKPEITVRIELGRGSESATIWTSDLSHDYVKINAEYRT